MDDKHINFDDEKLFRLKDEHCGYRFCPRCGATLVVVDPYRTGTAERADMHVAPRPGTDGALACAVMHVLFAENLADWDYLRRYTDAPDELAAHVAERSPQWLSGGST